MEFIFSFIYDSFCFIQKDFLKGCLCLSYVIVGVCLHKDVASLSNSVKHQETTCCELMLYKYN